MILAKSRQRVHVCVCVCVRVRLCLCVCFFVCFPIPLFKLLQMETAQETNKISGSPLTPTQGASTRIQSPHRIVRLSSAWGTGWSPRRPPCRFQRAGARPSGPSTPDENPRREGINGSGQESPGHRAHLMKQCSFPRN